MKLKEDMIFLITSTERFAILKSDRDELVRLIIDTQNMKLIKYLFVNYRFGDVNERFSSKNYKLGISDFDKYMGYRKFRLFRIT